LPVKKLGRAFTYAKLKRVVLPDTLEEIGYQAFYGASVFDEIVIPRNVLTIGNDAFCNFCGKVTFDENCRIKVISEKAFNGAKLDNVVVLPKTGHKAGRRCVLLDGIARIGTQRRLDIHRR